MTEPRRILSISGGGVRGIIAVAFLEAVEGIYRARRGPDARLCDVFDLVGGTSTGALIAAAVALGHPMEQVADFYLTRAKDYFKRRASWRLGLAPVYDAATLEKEIRLEVGDVRLGDPELRTLFAVVMKRLDTGASWIVSNIPSAPYFEDPPDNSFVGNRHYPLARLLRASTAAPVLFSQEVLEIVENEPPGVFVDGGISPYNDPSLALLMLARMQAFGLSWELGPEQLFVLSVGCGQVRRRLEPQSAASAGPLRLAAQALMGTTWDGMNHTRMMMQWLGVPLVQEPVNSEVGTLAEDHLFGTPIFSELNLDLPFDEDRLRAAGLDVAEATLKEYRVLDNPDIIHPLYDLARAWCANTYDLEALLP
ncbi:MAG: patatin-like phospholipase family protein [Pseudomonadota bacterium]